MVSHEDFVREVSLRICSSLDIKESLRSAFNYLKELVPLDLLSLIFVDERLGALRRIGEAFDTGQPPPDEILPLPEGMLEKLAARNFSNPLVIDYRDDLFRALAPKVQPEGITDLLVPLRINGKLVGGLILRAQGEDQYRSEHRALVGSLAQPFAVALGNALAHEEVLRYQAVLLDDKRFLNRELNPADSDQIIGGSTGLRNVMEMVSQVAPLNNTILLLGETGTGKEVIANAIHFSSSRKNGPFIKVNCGALPENLIDSELFGHEKGAFTGAHAESRGRFERANGGTIFLDEIGELPPTAQVRLLRVLQTHEIERVGGKRTIPVDLRVVAATHRNLRDMVAEGRFREDLWYRLSSFPIMVPPLRLRKEDVPALTRHFVEVKSRELGILAPPTIAPGALLRLTEYDWPGNVRELENLVERELILHHRGPLTFDLALPRQEQKSCSAPAPGAGSLYPFNLDEAMAVHITEVLKVTQGKIHGPGGAAELMGINANTLRTRMEKLGIPFPRQAPRKR
ncbi:sigma 54-interacting transcriptional regulator [Geomesophilobacter sediminis]|uniref:Sigma 54-interacting transcriptional regulator n=1 Tax=Geomesophilobacter sediminis TaxID=2798584 RepID=A0A8J7INX7_9BACT|nr:sigma 54-interacting transcriptional regulator [Geomesophilobacter sediminis]MBJ6725088.1 sigma 54-interacting transcriptional regulator [Geomesophilobacter sediminis]